MKKKKKTRSKQTNPNVMDPSRTHLLIPSNILSPEIAEQLLFCSYYYYYYYY